MRRRRSEERVDFALIERAVRQFCGIQTALSGSISRNVGPANDRRPDISTEWIVAPRNHLDMALDATAERQPLECQNEGLSAEQ
jgi:hypothetical protein